MHFTLTALALSALASASRLPHVSRQSCAESSEFGDLIAVPSDLYAGAGFTVHADFTCAIQLGVTPVYIDYYVEDTKGGQLPILLDRREFHLDAPPPPADTFSAEIPIGPTYSAAANYVVTLYTTYGTNNTNNQTYYQVGTTSTPINITASS
ncbi:hypothetical protein NEOLEDRAFT_1149885 [Neolentinus lepideus HHB14362 ss-1]|uniref:Lytic polysaccharide monooxygenase n=1 Tax=Neolentinus lepideus HHB14362 ss-1 TaxID=1314782 RepID=A0A165QNF9_9AGAM|nr:hypothetical protein NEOLEDRAFT_1149885 [Neolentinus lepideus HHB14362 ss-1]